MTTMKHRHQRRYYRHAKNGILSIRTGNIVGTILILCLVSIKLFRNVSNDDTTVVSFLSEIDYAASKSSNNKSKRKTINLAVLVAGSTSRFLFDSFVEHVVKPCPSTVQIEYFAVLTLKSGPAFRQDAGYMGLLAGRDKIFKDALLSSNIHQQPQTANDVQNLMYGVMTEALERYPSATIRGIRVLEEPIEDSPILQSLMIREVNKEKMKSSTNNAVITSSNNGHETIDLFQQFPMMDLRTKALSRTKAGNKNIIRLFLALESLYNTEFKRYEQLLKAEKDDNNDTTRTNNSNDNDNNIVDYVLILRDDTLWLDDFDLHAIINSDPTADAYVLSCDAREPKLLKTEINDHGILIKRNKSDIVGKYVTAMANAKLDMCHKSVESFLGKDRGCNSEMILKWIIEQEHKLKVKLVPQSLLPFQRSVLIHNGDGGGDDYYCYHKFCQSTDDPLKLPNNIQKCKDLNL